MNRSIALLDVPGRLRLSVLILKVTLLGVFAMGTFSANALEQPTYKVIQANEVFEIRKYEPYIVAEVVVPGPESEAGGQAFRLLGGYIFGANKGAKKLEMTAPVVQTPAAIPTKIDMTAPVVQTPTSAGFLVQFMMPSVYTLATLPEPNDPKVKLREVAGRMIAAHQYSGTWSQSNYDEHLNILKTALEKAGLKTIGEPLYSRYNGPMTPWFLRKNEVWFTVQP
jgi:hypothetical protein